MRKVLSVVMVLVCLTFAGLAQTGQQIVVHAGHVLDVKSGKTLTDQTIVIDNGKIELKRVKYPIEETIARLEASPVPERAKQLFSECLRLGKLPPHPAARSSES